MSPLYNLAGFHKYVTSTNGFWFTFDLTQFYPMSAIYERMSVNSRHICEQSASSICGKSEAMDTDLATPTISKSDRNLLLTCESATQINTGSKNMKDRMLTIWMEQQMMASQASDQSSCWMNTHTCNTFCCSGLKCFERVITHQIIVRLIPTCFKSFWTQGSRRAWGIIGSKSNKSVRKTCS